MTDTSVDTTGARIAQYRKLRHLTQKALAAKAQVSYGHLCKIEQGNKQAGPAVIASIARALCVPVTELTGQPYLEELRQDQLDGLIQPIREALDVYDLGADPDVQPRPTEELATHVERLCALVRAADLRTVASELPGLLIELTTAAHQRQTDHTWSMLASTYRSTYDVATKLGFTDLGALSLDRMAWASEKASDAVSASIRQYLRSLTYLRAGRYRTGMRIAEEGRKVAALAAPGMAREAITGQLHLGSAVIAARAGDRDAVEDHIGAAARIADGTGEIARVRWLAFGPTNVGAHHASALIDQGLYVRALEVANSIRVPADWPASRAAHHRAEIARAQLWTGRSDAAFRSLQEARRLAPQQTRHSPTVRDTIVGLLQARRAAPDTLANYAAWIGM